MPLTEATKAVVLEALEFRRRKTLEFREFDPAMADEQVVTIDAAITELKAASAAGEWRPLEDGMVFHYTEKIPAEWNYPAHVESIEFLEVRHNGTAIACGSMPNEDEQEANLPPHIRLCEYIGSQEDTQDGTNEQ